MQLARLLGGNVPYVTNIPVYDGTLLYKGQMVMRHAAWHNTETKYYINAYVSGSTTEAQDSIGILQASSTDAYASKENKKLYNLSSAAPTVVATTGFNWLPAIVNPDATYFAFYDQTLAKSCTTAVAASTTWVITALEDDIEGAWLYTTEGTDSAATYKGKLRYLTVSSSGTTTIDSAVTVDTSTDFIKLLPIGHRFCPLNLTATGMNTIIAVGTTIYLENIENWGRWESAPTHALRYWNDKGLEGLGGKLATFEAELVQLKHCWRNIV